eukprot:m.85133 g.85133  ORF g.85133 m.85133 type:complete len:621 (+) comp12776_c0_seq3:137-1999(+)
MMRWGLLLKLTVVVVVAIPSCHGDQNPFWPHYPGRELTVLNGQWQFGFAANVSDVVNFDIRQATFNTTAQVPSCFDIQPPGIEGPRGTAFYQRNITVQPHKQLLLHFAACSFYCQVYVDGVSVGDHRAGGYNPFWLSIGSFDSAQHTLTVLVDNRFNATTAPTHTGGDFYMYSGITRDVVLHQLPMANTSCYIQRVETFTVSLAGLVNVNLVTNNCADGPTQVQYAIDGGVSKDLTVTLSNGTGRFNVMVPNPQLWSLDAPSLHTLQVTTLVNSDSILVRFGLRVLGVDTRGRLTINNAAPKLKGYNRHTMWPDTGSALTLSQVKQDVMLLQELGVNYVRGAHYPQDQRFLDLCDEVGIVVWEETLGPSVSLLNLLDPYFMKFQVQAVNEMVSASINHPSVILHGFYNEGPSDKRSACPGYNTSAEAIRERVSGHFPPSRLVTWASDKGTNDVCLDIADVVSFNSYPGWYNHAGDLNEPAIFWKYMVDWVSSHQPTKPFFISETGGGGIYEWQNATDLFWSQKYQAELVKADVTVALESERLSGITVWQFNDIKANHGDTAKCGQCVYAPHPPSLSTPWNCSYIDASCSRPGGENHKGAVDFWRRPKEVFGVVQSLYSQP